MHQSFNQRVHFYYCVLVALKMHGKSKKAGGIRGKNNFLLKWLRRAQDNNIFPPATSNATIGSTQNQPVR